MLAQFALAQKTSPNVQLMSIDSVTHFAGAIPPQTIPNYLAAAQAASERFDILHAVAQTMAIYEQLGQTRPILYQHCSG